MNQESCPRKLHILVSFLVIAILSLYPPAKGLGAEPAVRIEKVGMHHSGRLVNVTVTLRKSEFARRTHVTGVSARTLSGTGTVVVEPFLDRDAGSVPQTVMLRCPVTVTRFAVTVNGSTQDAQGRIAYFSFSRAITSATREEASPK